MLHVAQLQSTEPQVDFYMSEERQFSNYIRKLDYDEIAIANHYWCELGYSLEEVKDQISIYHANLERLSEPTYEF